MGKNQPKERRRSQHAALSAAHDRFRNLFNGLCNPSQERKNVFSNDGPVKPIQLRPSTIDRALLKSAITSTPMPCRKQPCFDLESSENVSPIKPTQNCNQENSQSFDKLSCLETDEQNKVISVSSTLLSREDIQNLQSKIESCKASKVSNSVSEPSKSAKLEDIINKLKCSTPNYCENANKSLQTSRNSAEKLSFVNKLGRRHFRNFSTKERQTQTGISLDKSVVLLRDNTAREAKKGEDYFLLYEKDRLCNSFLDDLDVDEERNNFDDAHPWRVSSRLEKNRAEMKNSSLNRNVNLAVELTNKLRAKKFQEKKVFVNKKKIAVSSKARKSDVKLNSTKNEKMKQSKKINIIEDVVIPNNEIGISATKETFLTGTISEATDINSSKNCSKDPKNVEEPPPASRKRVQKALFEDVSIKNDSMTNSKGLERDQEVANLEKSLPTRIKAGDRKTSSRKASHKKDSLSYSRESKEGEEVLNLQQSFQTRKKYVHGKTLSEEVSLKSVSVRHPKEPQKDERLLSFAGPDGLMVDPQQLDKVLKVVLTPMKVAEEARKKCVQRNTLPEEVSLGNDSASHSKESQRGDEILYSAKFSHDNANSDQKSNEQIIDSQLSAKVVQSPFKMTEIVEEAFKSKGEATSKRKTPNNKRKGNLDVSEEVFKKPVAIKSKPSSRITPEDSHGKKANRSKKCNKGSRKISEAIHQSEVLEGSQESVSTLRRSGRERRQPFRPCAGYFTCSSTLEVEKLGASTLDSSSASIYYRRSSNASIRSTTTTKMKSSAITTIIEDLNEIDEIKDSDEQTTPQMQLSDHVDQMTTSASIRLDEPIPTTSKKTSTTKSRVSKRHSARNTRTKSQRLRESSVEITNVVNVCEGTRHRIVQYNSEGFTNGVSMARISKDDADISGILKIEHGRSKPQQVSQKYVLKFVVILGQAEFGILDKRYHCIVSDTVIIPKGTEYYIKNVSEFGPLLLDITTM